jgi:hypothetical protein
MAFKGKPSVLRGLGRIKIQQVVGLLLRFRPPVRPEMFYDCCNDQKTIRLHVLRAVYYGLVYRCRKVVPRSSECVRLVIIGGLRSKVATHA